MMESLLTAMLTLYARLYLWRFRPRIVGITGNSGKTSTRHAVAAVLGTRYRVRSPAANMNTDLGMATAVIGDFDDAYARTGGTARFWLGVLFRAKVGFWKSRKQYPEVLVLEYGADHPGDIKRLAKRFRPDIAVITQIGPTPVHLEFFASPKHLAQEKANLVRALPVTGHAVLNSDDLTVLELRDATHAPVTTFGLGEGADVRVTDLRVRMAGERPVGTACNLSVQGSTMPATVRGTLGRGVATAVAAAVAVGRIFDIGLADACEAISRMTPPPGRLRIMGGIKGTLILDDTYNASPAATHLAIETVRELPGRKVLVLGSMLELGSASPQAHQEIGTLAGDVAAELVCVGEGGRFIADAASNQMLKEKVRWFDDSTQAAPVVQTLIRPGDIILVKGSQGIRMERIVKEIMAEPARAGELLVRQSRRWLAK